MHTVWNRFVSLLLTLALLLTCAPWAYAAEREEPVLSMEAEAPADEPAEEVPEEAPVVEEEPAAEEPVLLQEAGSFTYYQNNNGGATITGYTGEAGDLVIPAGLDGLLVTEIRNKAFQGREDLKTLVDWVENSKELSNGALERAIAENPAGVALKKALSWSKAVNENINALPDDLKLPFPLAKEGLAHAHARADVAIVSSANLDAVLEEWEKYGLLEHTDIVMAQNAGSKAHCIGELLKKGYQPDHVLMCGDAPGDMDAAQKNGVFYYPILVRSEKASWQEFMDTACGKLLDGTYAGAYQDEKINMFLKNLGA